MLLSVVLGVWVNYIYHAAHQDQHGFIYWIIIVSSPVVMLMMFFCFFKIIVVYNQAVKDNSQLEDKYKESNNKECEGVLQSLLRALNFKDHDTWGHSARVVGYAVAIGREMGLAEKSIQFLMLGGYLHDIGKIGVPDAVLLKKSCLDEDEWRLIQGHPQAGYDIIKGIDFLEEAEDIVLLHHERFDGQGYPQGLKGEGIPLLARIFAVADALDAMTSDRPYRSACPVDVALEEIARESGKQFCPESVQALLAVGKERLAQIRVAVARDEFQVNWRSSLRSN